MLLFTTRSRIPPLRPLMAVRRGERLPFGFWSTRFGDGCLADGVLLRVADSAAAVSWLQSAGAERVDDPDRWLADHRALITDPRERRAVVRRQRTATWLVRASRITQLAAMVAWLSAVATSGWSKRILIAATIAAIAATVALGLGREAPHRLTDGLRSHASRPAPPARDPLPWTEVYSAPSWVVGLGVLVAEEFCVPGDLRVDGFVVVKFPDLLGVLREK